MELQPPIRGLFYALNALVDADNTGKPVFVHILFVRCRIGGEENIRCRSTQLGGVWRREVHCFFILASKMCCNSYHLNIFRLEKCLINHFYFFASNIGDELKPEQSNISSETEFEVL